MKILYKAKGDPQGKSRIWFTCHPADLAHLDTICSLLWKSHDCVVYYTEDMSAPLEDMETDIGSNNLLVVPVTRKLLTESNRALDTDVPYALSQHMPVLPLMMEEGLDGLYSHPDKFGDLQYLSLVTEDTQITLDTKLKNYLNTVLLDPKTIRRIREIFDAYIFLSYRKKDRRYANELMRLIHKDPRFQRIAIWYDEFLTPGESFRDNIHKILSTSQLFALLVTPNLLEEGNYVMTTEYPEAQKAGKPILPAQMERTDRTALCSHYPSLPDCIDPQNQNLLATALERLAKTADDTPEHQYLLGLAYLEGIDVEVDRPRGAALIAQAAKQQLPEAMEKLYHMHMDGHGVAVDYKVCSNTAVDLYRYYGARYGKHHGRTLHWLSRIGRCLILQGNFSAAAQWLQDTYLAAREHLGKTHGITLRTLRDLITAYHSGGQYHKALETCRTYCALWQERLGPEHPNLAILDGDLAGIYTSLGRYEEALPLAQRAYEHLRATRGDEDAQTLYILRRLGDIHGYLGNTQQNLQLTKTAYDGICQQFHENHPRRVPFSMSLGDALQRSGEYKAAEERFQESSRIGYFSLGADHPTTLSAWARLAHLYLDSGNADAAMLLCETYHDSCWQGLGKQHPLTLRYAYLFGLAHLQKNAPQKALPWLQESYQGRRECLGDDHPFTRRSLEKLEEAKAALPATASESFWDNDACFDIDNLLTPPKTE